jgi:hypothetical protein
VAPALFIGLALLATLLVFAACGGGGEDEGDATATATGTGGLKLPPDLTDEQKDAVLQIKNLGNGTEPLATLVSHKALTADEIGAAIEDDPKFAELDALAEDAGFGRARAGVELKYDNDVTVTAALLDSPEGGLALAMRETGPSPAYLVVHVASDGKTVTEYNSEGTVTLDVETLEGSAVDAPDAQHSCRVGHCIFAALTWLSDSWYGWLVGEICQACMESVVALPVTAGASAVLSIPSCMVCIPGLVAAGVSSTIVCYDAPCSYCTDNSCGDPPRSHDEYCIGYGMVPADPETGLSAAVTGADSGYYCDGITENWDGSQDYSASECRGGSESTGVVRACPYGCADPPAGDTRSRDCAPPTTCDPATCSGEQPTGEPYCVARAAPYNAVIKQDYELRECVPAIYPGGSKCQTSTEEREVEECASGCSAEGTSCAEPTQTTSCDPATCNGDKPKGDAVCTTNPGGLTGEVTQQNERCSCQTVGSISSCVCVPIAPTVSFCALGCATDGRSCAGPGGSRGDGCEPSTCEQPDVPISDPRCVFRPDDQQWIIERDYDHWECSPVQGGDDATCVEMTITKFEEACPNGCAPDQASCAESAASQITGKVMVAMSPDLYTECFACTVRLTGPDGDFTATSSSSDATFAMSDVPAGSYRVQRQCGGEWVDAHAPYDDTSLGYPNLTVPPTANPDILVGPCDGGG